MATSLRFLAANLITDTPQGFVLNGPNVITDTVLECVSGNPTITITSGSFLDLRVRRWALLAGVGGIKLRFPANTRVLTVSAASLQMSADAISSTSVGVPESGIFTPGVLTDATMEEPPYLVDNLVNADRRVVHKNPDGVVYTYDYDLGSNRTVTAAGLHGHRGLVAGLGISSVVTKYATAATGYPPASGGSWTNASNGAFSSVQGLRDKVQLLTADGHSARYWRFDVDAVLSGFTLGKFLLGAISFDLGFLYSSADIEDITPQAEERSGGLDPIVTVIGDRRRQWDLEYKSVTATTLNQWLAIAARMASFIMLDENDTPWEVIIRGGRIKFTHKWFSGSTSLYDITVPLEQLG